MVTHSSAYPSHPTDRSSSPQHTQLPLAMAAPSPSSLSGEAAWLPRVDHLHRLLQDEERWMSLKRAAAGDDSDVRQNGWDTDTRKEVGKDRYGRNGTFFHLRSSPPLIPFTGRRLLYPIPRTPRQHWSFALLRRRRSPLGYCRYQCPLSDGLLTRSGDRSVNLIPTFPRTRPPGDDDRPPTQIRSRPLLATHETTREIRTARVPIRRGLSQARKREWMRGAFG